MRVAKFGVWLFFIVAIVISVDSNMGGADRTQFILGSLILSNVWMAAVLIIGEIHEIGESK